MPRLLFGNSYGLGNSLSILAPRNAGFAEGTSTRMTISNDLFSLTVTGSGLVAKESNGHFSGFSAGTATGLEFRQGTTLIARFEALTFDLKTLSRSSVESLLLTQDWDVRSETSPVDLFLDSTLPFGNATLHGGTGADTLSGSDGDDVVIGGKGGDELMASEGADRLYGGDGRDLIYQGGSNGHAIGYGGGGNDNISQVAVAYGGIGADTVEGAERAYGGAGRDVVSGWGRLEGGDGNDRLSTLGSGSSMYGGDGDDRLTIGGNIDPLTQTSFFYGGTGNDFLRGHQDGGVSSAGSDKMEGGAGQDTLKGMKGDDTLRGGSGHDAIYGGDDVDRLAGGAGNDTLLGDAGADNLFGGTGNDVLTGGTQNDTLSGGAGLDTLNGSAGNDDLRGGDGADQFLFGVSMGHDRVLDFDHNLDTLVLEGVADASVTAEGVLLTLRLDSTSELLIMGASRADLEGRDNIIFA